MRIREKIQELDDSNNDDGDVLLSTVLNGRMSLARIAEGMIMLYVGFVVLVVRVLLLYGVIRCECPLKD